MSDGFDGFRDDRRGAVFSDDREYRYRLWRTWDASRPACAFVMLNPSTADETDLDQTCRRCKGFADDWGYGSLIVGNIFALTSTDPDALYDHSAPVGPENDAHLARICDDADRVVAAWGAHGDLHGRGREAARALNDHLSERGETLYALDTTKDGHPNHPLYQPADIEPAPFSYDDDHRHDDGGDDAE